MINPSPFITYGLIAIVIGIVVVVINIMCFAKNALNRNIFSVFFFHLIGGIMYIGGGTSFVIGLIIWLINYIKS